MHARGLISLRAGLPRAGALLAALAAALLSGCTTRPPPVESTAPPPAQGRSHHTKTLPYEVLGRRYVPLLSSDGYLERGVASWYGPKFHGKPTANGEKYDMHGLTAAHKTLPIPSWVTVTNLRNGHTVAVRINDRGPFVDNRLIDLSYAAATELDMLGPGTSLVEVRAVPPPAATATQAAPVAAPAAAAPLDEPMFVQVGAFADPGNALRVRETLEGGGFAGVRVESLQRAGQPLYRVQVGPVASVEQFDLLIERLASVGFGGARLAID